MQQKLYPLRPETVPQNFTQPGKAYHKHIIAASSALVLFVVLYFGLSGWFMYKSFKLLINTFGGGKDPIISFLSAVVLGLLGVFMLKALFFLKRGSIEDSIEITADEEPELFAFINATADEVKAPRPHRVFLSKDVNAAVFYDISIINLLYPTKKNLEIGLGLINTLNLSEFKSILAHEFGHFTQRSMLIGRWVYIANQVADQIVNKRDKFDSFLGRLSTVDLRIAWTGWLLSIIVWSIRSISNLLFRLVVLTQRALSREMEFHADLVAVSVSGSDALINSLYKFSSAEDGLQEALNFANRQLGQKHLIPDLFAIQSNAVQQKTTVLGDPTYSTVPKNHLEDPAKFRIFREEIARTPKMWNTHPANADREKNAKKVYLYTQENSLSSWSLFTDSSATRAKMTQSLYRHADTSEAQMLSEEDSLELHNKNYNYVFLNSSYKGNYLNRYLFTEIESVDAIYTLPDAENTLAFDKLYPDTLPETIAAWRKLEEEIIQLQGLQNKVLEGNEGKIIYRNTEIKRPDLPEVVASTKADAHVLKERLLQHDLLVRRMHYAAAQRVAPEWGNYLISLTRVIHYAEHSLRRMEIHRDFFYRTLNVTMQMRSSKENRIWPLLDAANELYAAMQEVFLKAEQIILNEPVAARLKITQYKDLLEEFRLGKAYRENINEWINVVESWKNVADNALIEFRAACLDELLIAEKYVQQRWLGAEQPPQDVPSLLQTPDEYTTADKMQERSVTQKVDLLSRFYYSNEVLPTAGRLVVAGLIVFLAVFASTSIGKSELYIYNALSIPVIVHAGDSKISIDATTSEKISIDESGTINIRTTTAEGADIETFRQALPDYSRTLLYNIAGAGVLYEWSAYYGTFQSGAQQDPPRIIGAPRWLETPVDYLFEEPPASIELHAGEGAIKRVLNVVKDHPSVLASLLTDEQEKKQLISSQATWSDTHSSSILSWLMIASGLPNGQDIIKKRLDRDSLEIVSLRIQQDFCDSNLQQSVYAQHNALYERHKDNPGLYYLHCRTIQDETAQDQAFAEGHKKWPDNPWLAYASAFGLTTQERWSNAQTNFRTAYEKAPEIREAIVEELSRIQRMLGEPEALIIPPDSILPPSIRQVYSAQKALSYNDESGKTNKFFAYRLLAEGKLKEALDCSVSDTDFHGTILRLAAVSDGATAAMKAQALLLVNEVGLSPATLIPTLALLARQQKNLDQHKQYITQWGYQNDAQIHRFIAAVQARDIMTADGLMNSFTSEMKGKMGLFGILVIGRNNVPERWNTYATKLLFITEKPYLL